MWQQEESKYIVDSNGNPFNPIDEPKSIFETGISCFNPEHNKLIEEINQLKHKLKQCEIISNNVLYFHDKSDYEISLYEILNIIQDKNINESRYDKLSYMEE